MAKPQTITLCSEDVKDGDINSSPLMCGVCEEKFAKLDAFLLHVPSHNSLFNKYLHVCDYNTESSHSNSERSIYKCRTCSEQFSSICLLHNHIVQKSGDGGSYIFDNTKNMAYPLSMKCSGDMLQELCEDDASMRAEAVKDNELDNLIKALEGFLACALKLNNKHLKPYLKDSTVTTGLKKAKDNKNKHSKRKEKSSKTTKKKADKTDKSSPKRSVRTVSKKVQDDKKTKEKGEDSKSVKSKSGRKRKNTTGKEFDKLSGQSDDKKSCLESVKNHEIVAVVKIEPDSVAEVDTGSIAQVDYKNNSLNSVEIKVDETAVDMTCDKPFSVNDEINDKNKKSNTLQTNASKPERKRKPEVECMYCSKAMTPGRLKHHLKSHSDERPFKCDKCPKAYKSRSHLIDHKAIHEEVKPFYCEVCGKGINSSSGLRNHTLMHHSSTRPYKCEDCGASFVTKFRLDRHRHMHTGIKSQQCDLCGMSFATKYNLSVHIKGVHKNDRRFSCSECEKHFMTNYQLKIHLMKHSGERPFKCALCQSDYIERKELRRHLKQQHDLKMEEGNYYIDGVSSVTNEDHCQEAKFPTIKYDDTDPTCVDPSFSTYIMGTTNNDITVPPAAIDDSDVFCTKRERETIPTDFDELNRKSPGINTDVQDMEENSSVLPGVPLTVTSMPPSFVSSLITEEDNDSPSNE